MQTQHLQKWRTLVKCWAFLDSMEDLLSFECDGTSLRSWKLLGTQTLDCVSDVWSYPTWVPTCTTLSGWWFGCHFLNFPRNIGFLIIPIDELIFFRGVAQPPTSCLGHVEKPGKKLAPASCLISDGATVHRTVARWQVNHAQGEFERTTKYHLVN